MPAYPNIIPDWLKSENASVLDPAWKRGLRKVGSLIGVDDPAGQVMGTTGPLMAAGEGLGPLASKAVSGLKGFYSRLSNAMGSLPEMVNPAKAMSIAKNQASGEEIGYRKLGEFLGTQPPNQRMPKAAIMQHLEQNPPPQLEVKTYRGTRPRIRTPEDVFTDMEDVTSPKYASYQVPSGQNYREDLIKLPVSKEQAEVATYWPEDRPHYLPPGVQAPYTSMHWPEDPNTLVHVRSGEHVLPEGAKGRLIENIQSDWHQAGAREGYAANTPRPSVMDIDVAYQQYADKLSEKISTDISDHNFRIVQNELDVLHDRWDNLRRAYEGDPKGVPDAPFKQNWADLALKQQLLDLAEDPQLEWIGITPGSESVKRGELLSPEFHDVTLPRKLEELLKPFGGKMEQGELLGSASRYVDTAEALPFSLARLTPEMKAAILKKGFPLMSLLGLINAAPQREK